MMAMRSLVEPVALTLEVRLSSDVAQEVEKLHEQLHDFFSDKTIPCKDYDVMSSDLTPELSSIIHSIHISYPDADGVESDGRMCRFWWEIRPEIFIYRMCEEGVVEEAEDEENGSFCREWKLPAVEFMDVWDHLHFDDDLKLRLLRYVETGLLFSEKGIHQDVINWNRLVLLHGPPGTGKTSLCKALAQKIAIRHHSTYSRGIQLMEVNAHSLFSKWFSESGKLVAQMFEKFHECVRFPDVLLFVLIDEVESLTSARKSAVCGSEPSDALRAVNALLTQLDRLQRCSNVVVMTTSNLTEAIDDAFLDRADVKTFVGPPSLTVRYQILLSCIQELLRVGFVEIQDGFTKAEDFTGENPSETVELRSVSSPDALLQQCAMLAEGCSCRALKKLPFLASVHCKTTPPIPCTTFLQALKTTIQTDAEDRNKLLNNTTEESNECQC